MSSLVHQALPEPSVRWQSANVATAYDAERFSSVAGRVFNYLSKRAIRRALNAIPGGPAAILDLPCGTGRATAVAVESGRPVVGADISAEMMEQAAMRLGRCCPPLVRCDVSRQPFRDASVDCVMSIRFLMHLGRDARRAALREMARVAGRYVVVEYGYTSRWLGIRRAVRQAVLSLRGRTPSPTSAVTWNEIMMDIEAAGLKLVRTCRTAPALSESVVLLLGKR